jgi:hypothetical protein
MMILTKGTVCVRCHDAFLLDHEGVQLVLDVTEPFLHLHLSLHHLSNVIQTVFAAVIFIFGPGTLHCKKRLRVFLSSPAGMSLTKPSLAGNY